MKYNVLLIAMLIFVSMAQSQDFTINNQVTFGGDYIDWLQCATQTQDGGFIAGGTSGSDATNDKTEDSRGGFDYWIVKFDENYNELWQKTIGGLDGEGLYKIVETQDGGFLLGGYSVSDSSGDKTIDSKGYADYWVLKLNSNGDILWQNVYGGNDGDYLFDILEVEGGYLLSGHSNSGISGDKTEDSRGYYDYWVVKIDSVGNLLWEKTYGGAGFEGDCTIKALNGGYILSGKSTSNISGEKTEDCYGFSDVWLINIDILGNIIWNKTLGGDDEEYSFAGVVVDDNFIYSFNTSKSNISGVKTQDSKGGADYWLVKLDLNGNIIWDKSYGGSEGEDAQSIIIIENNNLLIAGNSVSNISGDKTEDSRGGHDYWVLNIDTSGAIQWQKTIGGDASDVLMQTIEKNQNNYILLGYSKSEISGDKTDYCRGEEDFWIVGLNYTSNIENFQIQQNAFDVFPNPAKENINVHFKDSKFIYAITLCSLQGKEIKKEIYNNWNNSISIELNDISKGLYLIKIETEDGIFIKKTTIL